MNPFDFVNAITFTKKDLITDDASEKAYNAFMVNRGLSQFEDTIFFANEMNKYHKLDAKLQFSFMINIVRKRKRFSKWAKADTSNLAMIEVIKTYYGYSNDKARQVLPLLSNEQLNELKEKVDHGGTK